MAISTGPNDLPKSIAPIQHVQCPTFGCGIIEATSGGAPESESMHLDDDVSIPDAQLLEIEMPDPVGPTLSLPKKVTSCPCVLDLCANRYLCVHI